MAFVNTGDCQCTLDIENDSHVVRILQGLLADESGASALYSKVIDSLKKKGGYEFIIDRLEEIRNDELQHAGSLIECMTALENNITVQYAKGGEGD